MEHKMSGRFVRILDLCGVSYDARRGTVKQFSSENAILVNLIKAEMPRLVATASSNIVSVLQYLTLSSSLIASDFAMLDSFLSKRSFFVGNSISLADIAMFEAVSRMNGLMEPTPNLARWLAHIAYLLKIASLTNKTSRATVIPLLSVPEISKASSSSTTTTSATSTTIPNKEKKEKKIKEPAIVANIEGKDENVAAADLDPSKLDIRVGLVLKCWDHPEADKLLCEEIDLGENAPRTIASGLRAHYSAQEVQGKKVLVLANLKDRTMVGFKSQGMVLCACNSDHSVVRLLEPPAAALPGDRVTFPGYSGEPAPSAQVAKKKILEKLAPQLRTDSAGVAHWASSPFTVDQAQISSLETNQDISMKDQPEKMLKMLRRMDSNRICPNCGIISEFGFGNVCVKFRTFVCDLCKTSHQAISHRVKSITMSNWTLDEVNELSDQMAGGNDAARHVWLLNAPACGGRYAGGSRPRKGDHVEIFKKFVVDCYEHGKYRADSPYAPNASIPRPLPTPTNSSEVSASAAASQTLTTRQAPSTIPIVVSAANPQYYPPKSPKPCTGRALTVNAPALAAVVDLLGMDDAPTPPPVKVQQQPCGIAPPSFGEFQSGPPARTATVDFDEFSDFYSVSTQHQQQCTSSSHDFGDFTEFQAASSVSSAGVALNAASNADFDSFATFQDFQSSSSSYSGSEVARSDSSSDVLAQDTLNRGGGPFAALKGSKSVDSFPIFTCTAHITPIANPAPVAALAPAAMRLDTASIAISSMALPTPGTYCGPAIISNSQSQGYPRDGRVWVTAAAASPGYVQPPFPPSNTGYTLGTLGYANMPAGSGSVHSSGNTATNIFGSAQRRMDGLAGVGVGPAGSMAWSAQRQQDPGAFDFISNTMQSYKQASNQNTGR